MKTFASFKRITTFRTVTLHTATVNTEHLIPRHLIPPTFRRPTADNSYRDTLSQYRWNHFAYFAFLGKSYF